MGPNLQDNATGVFWGAFTLFACTTASIMSGAVIERIRMAAFIVLAVVLGSVVWNLSAAWGWHPDGWMVKKWGYHDFGASGVVHMISGFFALGVLINLGPRIGKYKDGKTVPMPGSNLALATLGTFILWLGWFGFNGGSQLAAGTVGDITDIGRIFANTNMAAAAGSFAALVMTQILYKKVDLTMVLNGALAGLVSITAEPLAPTLLSAMLIGGVGGVIVVFAVPMLDKLKIDDVVGAIPVHLMAGIWGTLAVAFSGSATITAQLTGIVAYGVFTFVASLIIWSILKAVMGIRVSEEAEINGLDMAELGMEAYPEFSKG